jgi:tetratricopeptide (TPR) repeat protein
MNSPEQPASKKTANPAAQRRKSIRNAAPERRSTLTLVSGERKAAGVARHSRTTELISNSKLLHELSQDERVKLEKSALESLAQDPCSPAAHLAVAETYNYLRRFDEAFQHGNRALALQPYSADARVAIGASLVGKGEFGAAKPFLDEALRLKPRGARAHWLRAHSNLALCDFVNGFRDYEYGYVLSPRKMRGLPSERWRGEPVGRLFIHTEQGLGDNIQLARFIQLAREVSKAEIILEALPPLVGILENFADRTWAQTSDASVPFDFDAHVSIFSLPFVLGIETIDGSPYLAAPPLPWGLKGAKVGLSWRGNPQNPTDSDRSLSIEEARMFEGVAPLVLIQPEGDLPFELPRQCGADMAATASIIAALDLIVTVDTSVAHLAGALGKECWLIPPRFGEWRWGCDTKRSVWYDSIEIFPSRGSDRKVAINNVIARLRKRYPAGTWEHQYENSKTDARPDKKRRKGGSKPLSRMPSQIIG